MQQLRWLVPVLILGLMVIAVLSPSAFADGPLGAVDFAQTQPPNAVPPRAPTPTPSPSPSTSTAPARVPAQAPAQLPTALPAAGDLGQVGSAIAALGIALVGIGIGVRRRRDHRA